MILKWGLCYGTDPINVLGNISWLTHNGIKRITSTTFNREFSGGVNRFKRSLNQMINTSSEITIISNNLVNNTI